MPRLNHSLEFLGTPRFETELKAEIAALGAAGLPLQAGLRTGSVALDDRLEVTILGVDEGPDTLRVRAGLFYTSIIAGCACADDPTPVDENAEYCQVRVEIDRQSGEARISLA
ncbi:hypothetical protein [Thioalkalivibrio sulfidiphilus]|uniref:hypothetical protein n=1 Tax=Thioalkalivibrio sulfidiphilus TaxID=1033854 RepID=UPI0003A10BDC|nr:hypothetical protein [Thioalkalivibrio sulfidiphilus]